MQKRIFIFFLLLLALCGVTYMLYLLNERSLAGVDDANIYFIYMRNFSQGEGFVYNVGGERVEGFTSLLWCLLGAFFFRISATPEIWLLATNLLAVTYALWKLVLFMDDHFNQTQWVSPSTFFLLLVLCIFPGYFEWTLLSLLETGIWSTLLILGFINLLRWPKEPQNRARLTWEFSILLVLLVPARPESYLWGSFFLAVRWVQAYRYRMPGTWIKAAVPSGLFVGTAVAVVCWRLWYFGYPLPNTYYAKVSQDTAYNLQTGLRYLWEFTQNTNPFVWTLPLALLLYGFAPVTKKRETPVYILLSCTAITLALPLYSGGDHFGLGRLLQPTLPVMYFAVYLFAKESAKAYRISPRGKYATLLAVVLVFAAMPARDRLLDSLKTGKGPIRTGFVIAKYDRYFGEHLSRFFAELPAYPSQGVITAGGNAYRYKGKTIDLLGLNNVAMAHADRIKTRDLLSGHASFSKEVFYEQQPDLVWMVPTRFIPLEDTATALPPDSYPEFEHDLVNVSLKHLAYDSRFRELYYPVYIHKVGDPECLFGYAHKDFLRQLPQPLYRYGILPRER